MDKAQTIGGLMTQLDRTFPTNNCDLCTLAPNLSESGRRKHIELLTMSTVTGITGEKGHFTATVLTAPATSMKINVLAVENVTKSSLNA